VEGEQEIEEADFELSLQCMFTYAPEASSFLSTSFSSFYLPITQYVPFSFFSSIVQGQL